MHHLTTLECLVQNRLGALDRILGALTHRGILPRRMETFQDGINNTMCIRVEFACEDSKMLEKLVKFLEKQVYVLNTTASTIQPVQIDEMNELNELFVA